jgi:hypothetical protein
MYRFTIPGTFLSAVLFLAACGSGVGSNSSNGGGPTKAEFIKRAERICASTDKAQVEAVNAFMAKRPDAKRNKSLNEKIVVEVGLPPVREEIEKLDVLLMPGGDEGEIQVILDEVVKAIEKGEDDPSTMVDPGSIGPFAKASALAREYGFKACAFPL